MVVVDVLRGGAGTLSGDCNLLGGATRGSGDCKRSSLARFTGSGLFLGGAGESNLDGSLPSSGECDLKRSEDRSRLSLRGDGDRNTFPQVSGLEGRPAASSL